MVFVTGHDSARLVQGAPRGELSLRIVGSNRDGQVVRLSAAKCAVGSAAGCTLRLRARGVRPVHLVILRGTLGNVARAWAPNTRINGEPFRDAVLEPGDRLTVGPIEFEVLDSCESEPPAEGEPYAREPAASQPPEDMSRTLVLDRRGVPPRRKPEPQQDLPRSDKNRPQRRARRRQLVALLRLAHMEAAATLRQYQQSCSDIAELREQVARRDEQLRQIGDQQQTERSEWNTQLEAQRAAFHGQEAELAAHRQQLAESAERVAAIEARDAQLAALAAELDVRAQDLQQQAARLAETQVAVQRAEEEWISRQAEARSQHEQAWRELEEQRTAAAALEASHRDTITDTEHRALRLSAAETDLASREATLAEERALVEQSREEVEALRMALAAQQVEIAEQRQATEEARSELERRQVPSTELDAEREQVAEIQQPHEALQAQRTEVETATAEIAARREQLETLQQELATARVELEAERQRLASEREDWEAEQSQTAERLKREARHLESEREALADERERLLAEREAVQQAREQLQRSDEPIETRDETEQAETEETDDSEEAGSKPPLDPGYRSWEAQRAEYMERMAAEENHDFAGGHRVPDPREAETTRGSLLDTVHAPSPGEDEIDSHIAAFLERVRGSAPVRPIEPSPSRRSKRKSDPPLAETPKEASAPPSDAADRPLMDLSERPPVLKRRPKMVLPADLNAKMREVAIGQAHSAIDTHSQRQSLRHAYGTIGTSAACLVAALFVLWFADLAMLRMVAFVILVVGIFWMTRSIRAANRILAAMRERRAGGLRAIMAEVDAELAILEKEKAAAGEEPLTSP